MFASKTPRDLNHDPEPWRQPWPGLRRSESRSPFNVHDRWEFLPRPEFDHAQHNEPNPILVAMRAEGWTVADTLHSLERGDWDDSLTTIVAETHARRVLTRLARMQRFDRFEARRRADTSMPDSLTQRDDAARYGAAHSNSKGD